MRIFIVTSAALLSLSACSTTQREEVRADRANVEKQAKLPGDWLTTAFASEAERFTYVTDNDLHELPLSMTGFLEFFEKRKARMRDRLTAALGVVQ